MHQDLSVTPLSRVCFITLLARICYLLGQFVGFFFFFLSFSKFEDLVCGSFLFL